MHRLLASAAGIRLCALSLALAGAQDSPKGPVEHTLRFAPEPGSGWTSKNQWVQDLEASRVMKFRFDHAGESKDDEKTLEEHRRQEARSRTRVEFLEVEKGEIRGARYTLEESRRKVTLEHNGETLQKGDKFEPAPYEGAEVTLRCGKEENEVSIKGGDLDEAGREQMKEGSKFRDLTPLFVYVLPPDPVKVGATWTIEGRALRQILSHTLANGDDEERAAKADPKSRETERDLTGDLTARLAEVEEEGDRRIATISVAGRPKEEGSSSTEDTEESWTTSFEVKGTLRFAIDLGSPRSAEWSVTARTRRKTTREQEDSEADMRIAITGTAEETLTYEGQSAYEPLAEPASKPAKQGAGEE